MGFSGVTGEDRRTEVTQRIRHRSDVSGFTEPNFARWLAELILHHPTPPQVREVCCSFPDLFSVDDLEE